MRSLALVVTLVGGLGAASPDREWKVRDVTIDPESAQSKLMLVVPEYCRDENGTQRLRRLTLKHKRLVLPVWDAACRRVRAPSN